MNRLRCVEQPRVENWVSDTSAQPVERPSPITYHQLPKGNERTLSPQRQGFVFPSLLLYEGVPSADDIDAKVGPKVDGLGHHSDPYLGALSVGGPGKDWGG